MGRASRRPRTPAALNRGDAGRMVMAHGACVMLLATDLRVQQFYTEWLAAQERLRRAGPPAGVQTVDDLERVIVAGREADIDGLAEVLQTMGVPWRWAAEALIMMVFPIAQYNARHPHDQKALHVSASGLAAVPAGRKPRHQGRDVRQWVDWWYRHKIKHPPDSIYALAKEYADREKRHTRADSVVVDGIQRAENLLNRVMPPKRGARIL